MGFKAWWSRYDQKKNPRRGFASTRISLSLRMARSSKSRVLSLRARLSGKSWINSQERSRVVRMRIRISKRSASMAISYSSISRWSKARTQAKDQCSTRIRKVSTRHSSSTCATQKSLHVWHVKLSSASLGTSSAYAIAMNATCISVVLRIKASRSSPRQTCSPTIRMIKFRLMLNESSNYSTWCPSSTSQTWRQ